MGASRGEGTFSSAGNQTVFRSAFWITALYQMPFADISPFLLTVFSTDQKFLILTKSRLSVISFRYHAFAVVSEKSATNPRSSGFSPVSSSGRFID